jgi:glycerol-3-phosphate dehydrogenase (NAD(P)+)
MSGQQNIGVIGAGAWGTALAQMLSSDGRDVVLWAFEPEVVTAINSEQRNPLYLPSASLAPTIRATGNLADFAGIDAVLVVTPAQVLGRVLGGLSRPPRDLVLCSKGIEAGTGKLMNDVAREASPGSAIAVLSGGGAAQWERLAPAIARPTFRPYFSDDVTGAEIGGAVKNVLAIACGVVEGLALGQNARAALIARGYAEMLRFGEALGAKAETLSGLCGLGDLVLTCSSTSSRNFSLGKALGEGASAAAMMADRRTVAEGAHTAPVLADLADKRGIAMPIVSAVAAILGGASAGRVVADLLARPLRAELESDAKDLS